MSNVFSMDKTKLKELLADKFKIYNEYKEQSLKLDMSRGKPCKEQLELSVGLAEYSNIYFAKDGTDCRNYGILDGINEAKELFSQLVGAKKEQTIISGSSSLNIMYDTISRAMTFGILGNTPWCKLPKVKFLCPAPGYDRHFAITELFGIEMINIDMTQNGPDMDKIEELVVSDDTIKGIWCTPMYSNPEGITYSDETVRRFAKLKPKAVDFRIFWDNAYSVHHLSDEQDKLLNILDEADKNGNQDIVYVFSSTSKISFAGAGISVFASSINNINSIKKLMSIQTIGPDKLNQLKHVEYFKSFDGIVSHMKKHASIIAPKFETVLSILDSNLSDKGIATWNKPKGGYFISFNTIDGCAKRVIQLAKEAGVVLTSAGATFPYGKDPKDKNIRIAPTFPPIDELKVAMELFCLCVEIASIEKIIAN